MNTNDPAKIPDYLDPGKAYISISRKTGEQLNKLGIAAPFDDLRKLLVAALPTAEVLTETMELKFLARVRAAGKSFTLACVVHHDSPARAQKFTTILSEVVDEKFEKERLYTLRQGNVDALKRRAEYLNGLQTPDTAAPPDRKEQLLKEKEYVDRELRACKSEMFNAKEAAFRQGHYMDPRAFKKLDLTILQLGQRSQELQRLLGGTKSLPKIFMEIAQETLPTGEYQRIFEAAKKRQQTDK